MIFNRLWSRLVTKILVSFQVLGWLFRVQCTCNADYWGHNTVQYNQKNYSLSAEESMCCHGLSDFHSLCINCKKNVCGFNKKWFFFACKFLKFWSFINLPWGYVRSLTKLGPKLCKISRTRNEILGIFWCTNVVRLLATCEQNNLLSWRILSTLDLVSFLQDSNFFGPNLILKWKFWLINIGSSTQNAEFNFRRKQVD